MDMANKKTDSTNPSTPAKAYSAKVDLGLDSILPLLEKREKARDAVIGASRPLVRHCALAIKQLHAGEVEEAKKELAVLEKELKGLPASEADFEYLFEFIWILYIV